MLCCKKNKIILADNDGLTNCTRQYLTLLARNSCYCPCSGKMMTSSKWKHFPCYNWPFVRGIHRSPYLSYGKTKKRYWKCRMQNSGHFASVFWCWWDLLTIRQHRTQFPQLSMFVSCDTWNGLLVGYSVGWLFRCEAHWEKKELPKLQKCIEFMVTNLLPVPVRARKILL